MLNYFAECDYPFTSDKDSHIKRGHRTEEGKKRVYKCSICKHKCQNRSEFFYHCMSQHGGNDLYEFPNYVKDLNNPELQAECSITGQHILAGDEDDNLKKVYNFPTDNLHRGFNEIRGHLTQIYNNQKHAFRIKFLLV